MSDTVMNTSRVRVESITTISLSTFYFAIFLLYAAVRIISFQSIEEPRLWPDSRVYLRIASEPLWSPRLWVGGRPWTTSLVYKLLQNDLQSIVRFQLGLSIACWGFLALVVVRAVRSAWMKPIALAMILLFSLSAEVILWDGVILSDSISISLMALLIAGGLWLLEGWGWFKAAAVALVAFTWAFARDTNAWILLMIAGALSVGAIVRVIQSRYLLLAAAFAVIFAMNDVTANRAGRWKVAFMNVVGLRILPSPERTTYFVARGMPVTPALMERKNKKTWSDNWAFARDPALQSFRDWMYERGKSTYIRFLLSYPVFTIQEPLRHPEELLASELRNYAPVKFTAILEGAFAEAIYPKEWVLLWTWAAAVAIGLAVGLRLWTLNPAVVIALLLIVLAYPHAALQWHGDPNEIGRHGLMAGMHLRLGIWLLLIFAADMLVNHNNKTKIVADHASS